MIFKILLTERFSLHLMEMGDYIAQDNLQRAASWVTEIEKRVMKLDQFPEAHPFARENDNHDVELRQLVFGRGRNKYRIIFTVQEKEVVVLDIRHTAQDTNPLK